MIDQNIAKNTQTLGYINLIALAEDVSNSLIFRPFFIDKSMELSRYD